MQFRYPFALATLLCVQPGFSQTPLANPFDASVSQETLPHGVDATGTTVSNGLLEGIEWRFVGYGGYNFDVEGALIGLGIEANDIFQVGVVDGAARTTVETHFQDNASIVQVNVDLTPKYTFYDRYSVTVGVGFAWQRISFDNVDSSSSETGINGLIGIEREGPFLSPFARWRCTLFDGFDTDFAQQSLYAGVFLSF